jgi:NAD(P)-dependent dehydrogenase (short-subunit alcohol dehydrogenase family)
VASRESRSDRDASQDSPRHGRRFGHRARSSAHRLERRPRRAHPDRTELVDDELLRRGVRSSVCDVSRPAEVTGAVEEIVGNDSLDALVNCAGIMSRAPFAELPPEEAIAVVTTNLIGTMLTCKAALPRLAEREGSAIVNIGSIWARHVWPGRSAYSASKAGVEQFSRCLAVDLAGKVRVFCVSLGLVSSPFTISVTSDDQFMQSYLGRTVARRTMQPAEVSSLITRIIDGDLDYAVGEPIPIDGGYF